MNLKFLLTTLLILRVCTSFGQDITAKAKYLSEHNAQWDNGFLNTDRVFTPSVMKDQLFMIGEGHGIAYSYDLQYDLIAYLQKTAGVKYVLMELGYLDGIVLNDYLKTGNDSTYMAAFEKYNGTYYYNKSVHQLFKKLYQLNQTLPPAKRIVILAVDIEHGYRKAIKYLQENMFSGANANTPVGIALNKLDCEKGVGKEIAAEVVKIYPEYKANIASYHKTLGSKAEDADMLFKNTYEMLNIALKRSADARRDSVMLENFTAYKKRYHLNDQKLVGLFGGFHVKQTDQPADIRFAALLKRANAVKGICSAVMEYHDGFIMMPRGSNDTTRSANNKYKRVANTYDYSVMSVENGEELMAPFYKKGKAVLFDLTAQDSPFKGTKDFLMNKDQYADTDKMFQLLILVNDSPATEPLTGGMDALPAP